MGAGLDENVCTAYNFLCNNYCPGDELFFFGFSRGGYTARALAGFVATVGILPPGFMHYFSGMYEAYKNKGETRFTDTDWWKTQAESVRKSLRSAHINIQFVGVWDTVGSLGIPDSYLSRWTNANGSYKFYDTELHPSMYSEYLCTFLMTRVSSNVHSEQKSTKLPKHSHSMRTAGHSVLRYGSSEVVTGMAGPQI